MLTDSFVTHQIHADIRWLLNSPSLMALPEAQDAAHWLQHHASLLPHNNKDTFCSQFWQQRLGFYYENLLNHILLNRIQLTELKRNIQVISKLGTQGEFDFLFRMSVSDIYHIECAVKFYLCTGDGSDLTQFEGPNRRDRLDLKWNKLINKQIQLSTTPDGHATAEKLNILPNHTLILLQGYLFYPFTHPLRSDRLHPAINPSHQQGWWLRNHQLNHILADDFRYQILNKPYWLSCPDLPENELMTAEMIDKRLKEQKHPQFIVRLERPDTRWIEKDRGFVVHDNW